MKNSIIFHYFHSEHLNITNNKPVILVQTLCKIIHLYFCYKLNIN